MSVAPNLCCDETKNRGKYTRVTSMRGEGGRESERERERERAHAHGRESERKRFGSSFYMSFPPPGPALCKLGLARSAVCSVCSA